MSGLFRFLFGLPWPIMALFAAGLFWLAQESHQGATRFEAAKAEALAQPMPDPVPLQDFTSADLHAVDEVHVTAWIDPQHNYELTKQRKGTDTVRRMFVLFGPGDAPGGRVARGVVLLPPAQVDAFLELVIGHVADMTDPRWPFHLNGRRDTAPDLSDMVDDALEERGLLKAADFMAVDPFLYGREAGLAPDPGAPMRIASLFGGAGLVFALIALGKALRGKPRQRVVRPEVARAEVTHAAGETGLREPVSAPQGTRSLPGPTDFGYTTLPTPKAETWSPLEAVRAKQQAAQGVAPGAAPAGTMLREVAAKPTVAARRRGVSARNLFLALGVYAVIAVAVSGIGGPLMTGQMAEAPVDGILATLIAPNAPQGPDTAEGNLSVQRPDAPLKDGPVQGPVQATALEDRADGDGVASMEMAAPIAADAAWPTWVAQVMRGDVPTELRALFGRWAWVVTVGLVMLLSALMLVRRRRSGATAAGRDPWDRLSDRLR